MKVIKTYWFSNMTGVIGIVVGQDTVTGEHKAYIGWGSGLDEKADEQQVREWGSKVNVTVLEEILALLKRNP